MAVMTTDHFLTTCPQCGSDNRIPPDKVGRQGRCGRCRADLPRDSFRAVAPVALSEAQFDAVTRGGSLPVLVDFWAEWCAPCRQLAPSLEALAAEFTGRLIVVKVDTEAAHILPARFGVQAIPTMVLLRRGIEVERMTGALPLEAIRQRIEPFL